MTVRVALDVDGVLADYQGGVIRWLHSQGHYHLSVEDITRWDIFDCLGLRGLEGRFEQECLIKRDGCSSLAVCDGAVDFVKQLRVARYDVITVTSSYLAVPEWDHQRREWLRREFDIKAKDVIFTDRKDLIDADFLVDDKPSHVEAFDLGRYPARGILLDRPWNRNDAIGAGARVESLSAAYELIAAVYK